jgi:hypothetical protein
MYFGTAGTWFVRPDTSYFRRDRSCQYKTECENMCIGYIKTTLIYKLLCIYKSWIPSSILGEGKKDVGIMVGLPIILVDSTKSNTYL